mgnify:CR=1 FL=1
MALGPSRSARVTGRQVHNAGPEHASWGDMFRGEESGNASSVSVGKFQMFYFTLVAVVSYGSALAILFSRSARRSAESTRTHAIGQVESGLRAPPRWRTSRTRRDPTRHSPPARCSRKPTASWASRPAAPCSRCAWDDPTDGCRAPACAALGSGQQPRGARAFLTSFKSYELDHFPTQR